MVNSEGGRDPRSKPGPGRREFTGHMVSNEEGRGQSRVSLRPFRQEVLGDVPGEQQKRVTLWMWAWQVASGVEERPPMENRNHKAESGARGRVKIKTKEWKPASERPPGKNQESMESWRPRQKFWEERNGQHYREVKHCRGGK